MYSIIVFLMVSMSMYIVVGWEALSSWLILTGVYVIAEAAVGRVAVMAYGPLIVLALFAALMFYIGQPLVGAWCVASVLFTAIFG